MNPISSKLSWKYQKNKHLIESFLFRNAPEFLYKSNPAPLEGEIPVFTFHTALPDWFEEQCLHLVENGYKTLSADQFLHALIAPGGSIKKSVLLTFDDGLKHVWTVVYPILKKYDLKATCFLIPGCIPDHDQRVRPTLEDYWEHRASFKEIVHLGYGASALATWAEIEIMHESGVIDFQSHTMYHSLVHTSNKIFDFMNPDYDTYSYGNIHIPIYTCNGQDVVSRNPVMGMPIYSAQPRMTAKRRFFDDEHIRNLCIETVSQTGVEEFFRQKNWSRVLSKVISDHRKKLPVRERFETEDERDKAVFQELSLSRTVIEEKLPGKTVTHLCYPWYEGADFAVQQSEKAGFRANYFGTIRGRPSNRPGKDPYKIVRLEGFLLQRLPGIGRKKMRELLIRSCKSEII